LLLNTVVVVISNALCSICTLYIHFPFFVGYVNGIYVVFVRGTEENKRTFINLTMGIHLSKFLRSEESVK